MIISRINGDQRTDIPPRGTRYNRKMRDAGRLNRDGFLRIAIPLHLII
jgi:hypothetical protein